MGNPHHYAIDLPRRCHRLLEEYWGPVNKLGYEEFGGPLATTFLVAMTAPMINFPFERIHRDSPIKSERAVTPRLTDEIDRVLDLTHLYDAPFFEKGIWEYQFVPITPDFALSDIPTEILDGFGGDKTFEAASVLPTRTWFTAIRNAFAHSTITYADAAGRQDPHSPAKAIILVAQDRARNPENNHVFKISRDGLRHFSDRWMGWLTS